MSGSEDSDVQSEGDDEKSTVQPERKVSSSSDSESGSDNDNKPSVSKENEGANKSSSSDDSDDDGICTTVSPCPRCKFQLKF